MPGSVGWRAVGRRAVAVFRVSLCDWVAGWFPSRRARVRVRVRQDSVEWPVGIGQPSVFAGSLGGPASWSVWARQKPRAQCLLSRPARFAVRSSLVAIQLALCVTLSVLAHRKAGLSVAKALHGGIAAGAMAATRWLLATSVGSTRPSSRSALGDLDCGAGFGPGLRGAILALSLFVPARPSLSFQLCSHQRQKGWGGLAATEIQALWSQGRRGQFRPIGSGRVAAGLHPSPRCSTYHVERVAKPLTPVVCGAGAVMAYETLVADLNASDKTLRLAADAELQRLFRKVGDDKTTVGDEELRTRAIDLASEVCRTTPAMLARILDRRSLADAVLEGLCRPIGAEAPQTTLWALLRIVLQGQPKAAVAAAAALVRADSPLLRLVLEVGHLAFDADEAWRAKSALPTLDDARGMPSGNIAAFGVALRADTPLEHTAVAFLLSSEYELAHAERTDEERVEHLEHVFDWLDWPLQEPDDGDSKDSSRLLKWWRRLLYPRVVVWRGSGPSEELRQRAVRYVQSKDFELFDAWRYAAPQYREKMLLGAITNADFGDDARLRMAIQIVEPQSDTWLSPLAGRIRLLSERAPPDLSVELLNLLLHVHDAREWSIAELQLKAASDGPVGQAAGRHLARVDDEDVNFLQFSSPALHSYLSAASPPHVGVQLRAFWRRFDRPGSGIAAETARRILLAVSSVGESACAVNEWWPYAWTALVRGARSASNAQRKQWCEPWPGWMAHRALESADGRHYADLSWWWNSWLHTWFANLGSHAASEVLNRLAVQGLLANTESAEISLDAYFATGTTLTTVVSPETLECLRPHIADLVVRASVDDREILNQEIRATAEAMQTQLAAASSRLQSFAPLLDALETACRRLDPLRSAGSPTGETSNDRALIWLQDMAVRCGIRDPGTAAPSDWLDEPDAVNDKRFAPVLRLLAEAARRSMDSAFTEPDRGSYASGVVSLAARLTEIGAGVTAWMLHPREFLRVPTSAANQAWTHLLSNATRGEMGELLGRADAEGWAPMSGDQSWAVERWVDAWLGGRVDANWEAMPMVQREDRLRRISHKASAACAASADRREVASRLKRTARAKVAEQVALTLDIVESAMAPWFEMRLALQDLGIRPVFDGVGHVVTASQIAASQVTNVLQIQDATGAVVPTASVSGARVRSSGFAAEAYHGDADAIIVLPPTLVDECGRKPT